MSPWFLIALISLPILEIALLIKLVGALGFILTALLLVAAASLGMYFLREQGLNTWMQTQQALARGELPARQMFESGLVGLGALLLIIPGVLTDVLALLCLVPPIRRRIADFLLTRHFGLKSEAGPERKGPITIEGEFRRDDRPGP
jgi:UPF0716 protein FxsA